MFLGSACKFKSGSAHLRARVIIKVAERIRKAGNGRTRKLFTYHTALLDLPSLLRRTQAGQRRMCDRMGADIDKSGLAQFAHLVGDQNPITLQFVGMCSGPSGYPRDDRPPLAWI